MSAMSSLGSFISDSETYLETQDLEASVVSPSFETPAEYAKETGATSTNGPPMAETSPAVRPVTCKAFCGPVGRSGLVEGVGDSWETSISPDRGHHPHTAASEQYMCKESQLAFVASVYPSLATEGVKFIGSNEEVWAAARNMFIRAELSRPMPVAKLHETAASLTKVLQSVEIRMKAAMYPSPLATGTSGKRRYANIPSENHPRTSGKSPPPHNRLPPSGVPPSESAPGREPSQDYGFLTAQHSPDFSSTGASTCDSLTQSNHDALADEYQVVDNNYHNRAKKMLKTDGGVNQFI